LPETIWSAAASSGGSTSAARRRRWTPAQVNYGVWRGKGADAVVIGQVAAVPGGRFEVRFYLLDAIKRTQLAGFSYTITASQWRATAHQIADIIYEKLTGVPGAFSSRIAYVQKQGRRYELRVADADGQNPRTVVRSNESVISPRFSPDGSRIAYVSFEDKKPVVYVQSLRDGSRRKAAAFKGSNSAPAWSPDGRRLAVVLTRDNASQIYLINADGSGTDPSDPWRQPRYRAGLRAGWTVDLFHLGPRRQRRRSIGWRRAAANPNG
jgi:TolB protein